MANVISRGNNLPTQIVNEMFNAVRGESALAKVAAQRPVAFNGNTEMVFTMDHEASIVGENGAKVNGGGGAEPKTIRPVKFEYGLRVSDEFLYGSEEYRLDTLRTFAEGAARKIARGFDIAAMHGVNPYDGQASAVVNGNDLDDLITNDITYTGARADIRGAIALLAGGDVNGIVLSNTYAAALASEVSNGIAQNPEFYNSLKPETFLGVPGAVNSTVSFGATPAAHAYVGDWSAFRWGYAKEIPLEVIEYGNPDNDAQAGDLKGHNQVYLRAEAYIGWAILAPQMLAKVEP
jgi:hypothetical protein